MDFFFNYYFIYLFISGGNEEVEKTKHGLSGLGAARMLVAGCRILRTEISREFLE